MKKKIHPLAEIFPELSAAEFDKLKSSIDEHGQRETIVILGDEILDGRNRYKACLELGRNPQFRNFDPARDGNPIQFVADRNLTRRHLTPSQRAGIAKKIEDALKEDEKRRAEEAKAETEKPEPRKDPDEVPPTPAQKAEAAKAEEKPKTADGRPHREREAKAAEAAGTSPRALRDFKFVEKHSPADAKLVTTGKISMNEAKTRAKAKKDAASKFRNEAADLLGGSHDDDFAEKIRTGEILLTDSEIRAFSRLELRDQRRIRKLVEDGWKVARAVKFAKGEFEEKDSIGDLIAFFKAQDEKDLEDGWAQVNVAGHVFAIAKEEKTEAEADNGTT